MNETPPNPSSDSAAAPAPQNTPGLTISIVACVLGLLGIFTPIIGGILTLVALVLATIALVKGIKHKRASSITLSILAWVFVVAGFATSHFLLGLIGIAVVSSGAAG